MSGRLAFEVFIVANFKNALLKFSAFSRFSTRIASPHCVAGMLEHLVLPINCLAMCHHNLGFVLMPSFSLNARLALYALTASRIFQYTDF